MENQSSRFTVLFNVKNTVGITSIILSILMLIYTTNVDYDTYWLVPFIFGIAMLIIPRNLFSVTKISGLSVLYITMILRFMISPFVTFLGGYFSWRGVPVDGSMIHEGVVMIVYEMVATFGMIALCRRYILKTSVLSQTHQMKPLPRYGGYLLFSLFAALAVMAFPSAISDYRFSIGGTTNELIQLVTFPLSGLVRQSFDTLKIIIIVILSSVSLRLYQQRGWTFPLWGTMLVALVTAMFVSNMSRLAMIIPLLAIYFSLTQAFPTQRRKISFVLLGLILISAVFMSFYKFFGVGRGDTTNINNIGWWADTMQMYFAGPKNVGVAIKTDALGNPYHGLMRLILMFNDSFGNVMGLSSLCKLPSNSIDLFNYMYYGFKVGDQIVPNIGQGIFYFGRIFAPAWPAFFVWLSIWAGSKARFTTRIDSLILLNYISVCCGLLEMMNSQSIVMWSLNFTIVFVIARFLNRFTLKSKVLLIPRR